VLFDCGWVLLSGCFLFFYLVTTIEIQSSYLPSTRQSLDLFEEDILSVKCIS
jgi:hypothetical protein